MISYFVACSFLVACVAQHLDPRIRGGKVTTIQQFPFQVSVHFKSTTKAICNGIILNEDTILTGANCVFTDSPDDLFIRAGSTNLNSGGEVIDVTKVIVHEKYQPRVDYDIALLKLSKKITYSDVMKPADLIAEGENVPTGTEVFYTGWGAVGYWDKEFSEQLRVASTKVLDLNGCKYSLINIRKLTDNMICVGEDETGSCSGDSSAPLITNGKVVGLGTLSYQCGMYNFPSVFQMIAPSRSWIDSHIIDS